MHTYIKNVGFESTMITLFGLFIHVWILYWEYNKEENGLRKRANWGELWEKINNCIIPSFLDFSIFFLFCQNTKLSSDRFFVKTYFYNIHLKTINSLEI